MIEIKNVTAGYGKKEILHGISLAVKKGEILSLIGPNGCGKSTLLKASAGIIPYTSGSVAVDGADFSHIKGKARAKRIAYLPQERPVPEMTVGQLVLKGRFPHLLFAESYGKDDVTAAESAIEKLGLSSISDTPLSELSGGIRQKAYVAMALAGGADYLLLDEPFTHLDVPHRYELADLMRALADENRGIVTVMHEISDALAVSDRLAVMNEGKIIFVGTADELTSSDVLPRVFDVRYRTVSYDGKTAYYPERI